MEVKLTIIKGRPGGGKTRRVLTQLARLNGQKDILIVSPLKSLRNWMYRYITKELEAQYTMIVTSRPETCPRSTELASLVTELKRRYRLPSKILYSSLSTAVCRKCPLRKKCPYYKQFESVKNNEGITVVATQDMVFPLMYVKDWDIIYFDEFETFYNSINIPPINAKLVEFLEHKGVVEQEVARWIKEHWIYEEVDDPEISIDSIGMLKIKRIKRGGQYIMPISEIRAKEMVISSATLIPPLVRLVKKEFSAKMREIYTKGEDHLIFVNQTSTNINRVRLVKEIIEYLSTKEGKYLLKNRMVGIISPNYEITRLITSIIRKMGFSVFADVEHEKPPKWEDQNKYNFVITTKGKFFRGVNLGDKEFIFALYQWQNPAQETKIYNPYIEYKLEEIYGEDARYARHMIISWMVPAENVQALFRVNRIPSREHVMIMTREFRTALYRFMHKYMMKCKRENIDSFKELQNVIW